MRSFLSVIIIIFFNLLGFLFLLLYFAGGDKPDYLIAKSITEYPAASQYRVSATSGFPDGSPGGDISFETTDKAEQIMDFYKNEFAQNGWTLVSNSGPTLDQYSKMEQYETRYQKNLGFYKFNASVHKSETKREDYQKYTGRVIVFFDHREK